MRFFVAKLLSVATMTCSYVYHIRNLRPMIRLICYAHSNFSMRTKHVRMTRDPTVV